VKAATGEVVDAETLGGGDVHSRISGVTDHLAANDGEALATVRTIIASLNLRKEIPMRLRETAEPAYPTAELYGIVSNQFRFPYDVREVIARLVDASEFHEFKALYGSTLVCGFAHLYGYPIGIVANNGILFSE
jgi:3-methylcrotonyl-CoA carboxylase beta subunit